MLYFCSPASKVGETKTLKQKPSHSKKTRFGICRHPVWNVWGLCYDSRDGATNYRLRMIMLLNVDHHHHHHHHHAADDDDDDDDDDATFIQQVYTTYLYLQFLHERADPCDLIWCINNRLILRFLWMLFLRWLDVSVPCHFCLNLTKVDFSCQSTKEGTIGPYVFSAKNRKTHATHKKCMLPFTTVF